MVMPRVMCKPKITVVTVCYNAVDTIEKTIFSIINQTYENIEYILVDGGSTDGTVAIIKKYESRIAKWLSEPDKGIYDAMNKGVMMATGEWINFMNAGDEFYRTSTIDEVVLAGLDADYVVGIAKYPNGRYWPPIPEEFGLKNVCQGGAVNHQASFIRKNLFINEGYSLDYSIVADDLFFVKKVVFEGCSYKKIEVIVCKYDNGGTSNILRNQTKIDSERDNFYRNMLPKKIYSDYQFKKKRFFRYNPKYIVSKIISFVYIKFKVEKKTWALRFQ